MAEGATPACLVRSILSLYIISYLPNKVFQIWNYIENISAQTIVYRIPILLAFLHCKDFYPLVGHGKGRAAGLFSNNLFF
jgi:hypothetical protein